VWEDLSGEEFTRRWVDYLQPRFQNVLDLVRPPQDSAVRTLCLYYMLSPIRGRTRDQRPYPPLHVLPDGSNTR